MKWQAGLWTGLLAAALAAEALAGDIELIPPKLFSARGGLGNLFARLEAGRPVTIAYFGGSITAANGWRPKTLQWFQATWPKARITEVNAAIGGTGSDLGVFRCGQDVLAHKPDFVFVEFAVNDGGAAPESIFRTLEGIVRQVWRANPETDICFVYTIHKGFLPDYEKGFCNRSTTAHEKVADHYGIPSINMALRVAELHKAGKLIFPFPPKDTPPEGKMVFAHDECHPTDAGHALFTQVIAEALREIQKASKPGPHALPEPLRADNWENAKLVPIEPSMLTPGWKKLPADQGLGKAFGNRLPAIWEATQPGEKLSFRFKGTLARLYDLVGPDGGKAICTVDGKVTRTVPRFDMYCSYHRLATLGIAEGLEDKEHSVAVEVSPEQPDREPVLKQVRDQKGFDPKRYDGTVLRVGYIMLLGDLVKE
ncbi:MAG TPA: SGNH/GDSL hydrolase family protein [Planctomycetota bacterium]|nr:SGNH/GDSL hydrolase family protein [Planctomycetota bacterium]HRR82372.1 SGNH/GDSL hydrolase family protein [Planctomycetota bacterium]HRT95606.1 SGNH/GDSL hydrolase family protein [Planctomycetota bacterium]